MKINIFISWSGDYSQNIAKSLHSWLSKVIQFCQPYHSTDDISRGARWNFEITKKLVECKVGLLIITQDNRDSNWIHFEAGALSKSVEDSKVCPILFDLKPTDLGGPLAQFQSSPFCKEEMFKIIQMINQEGGELEISSEALSQTFENWWPILEKEINEIPYNSDQNIVLRQPLDIQIEVLEILRGIERSNNLLQKFFEREFHTIEYLISKFEKLTFNVNDDNGIDQFNLKLILLEMFGPIETFLQNINRYPYPPNEVEFILLQQKIRALKEIILEMNNMN